MITNKNQCTIRLLPDTIAIIPTLRFALDPAALTLLNASLDSDDPPDLELRAQIAPSREACSRNVCQGGREQRKSWL